MLPENHGAWPNPILLTHTATNPVPAGSAFDFTIYHQSGSNQTMIVTLRVFLDRDANPWSGDETMVYQEELAGTGTDAIESLNRSSQTDAAQLSPGVYRLLTRLSMGGRTRFLYAPAPVHLGPSVAAPSLTGLGMTNDTFQLRINGFAAQTVVTEASANLTQWTAIATNTISWNGFAFVDVPAEGTVSRFFRAVLHP